MATGDLWIAGASPSAVYQSTDGGATWGDATTDPSAKTSLTGIAVDARNSNVWVTGNISDSDYDPTGDSDWGSALAGPTGQTDLTGVAVDSRNGDIWVCGSDPDSIYKSTDGGSTWGSAISGPSRQTDLTGIAIDPFNGDVWVCGSVPDAIYKSTDGGSTWGSAISTPAGQSDVTGIAIDPRNGDVWISGSTPDSIYKSTDGGSTWGSAISGPSGQTNIRSIYIEGPHVPTASAGTAAIRNVVRGDEGTTIALRPTITKGTGVYDTVKYAWTVSHGTLDDATLERPTWTRPLINSDTIRATIGLVVTFEGDGTTARDGTSVTIARVTRQSTVDDIPPVLGAIAPSVVIDPVADANESTATTLTATLTGGNYDGAVTYRWAVSHGTLSSATAATPTWTRPATNADVTATIDLRVTVNGAGQFATRGTSDSQDATQASTVIRYIRPGVSAGNASAAIDAIASGAINTSVDLSATITKGTGVYDTVGYAWTVSAGTLRGANTATPTWTRPSVETNSVTVGLVVTLRGDGTTALASSSVALARVTRTAVVDPPVPNASAGNTTVTISPVADIDQGTTTTLRALFRKGTGVYDTVSYKWSVNQGTLDNAAAATPVWTAPRTESNLAAEILLTCVFRGNGNTAREGSSFSIRASTVRTTVLGGTASDTLDMSDANYIDFGGSKALTFGANVRVVGPFVPAGQRRFIQSVAISNTRFDISFASSGSGDQRADLTTEFERYGRFVFTIGGNEYIIPMRNRDISEPYRLSVPVATIRALFAAFDGTGTMRIELPRMNILWGTKQYVRVLHGGKVYDKIVHNGKTY